MHPQRVEFWEPTEPFSFNDISMPIPNDKAAPLDREIARADSCYQRDWVTNGAVHLPKFFPDSLIDRYVQLRARLDKPGGWSIECPYLYYDEIKDICLYQPLMLMMEHLLGSQMMLHLNLTGWVSTERNYHQDDYLNPPFVWSRYAAVWIALEDIHMDSGPFRYVKGSNRWPLIRQDLLERYFPGMLSDNQWPKKTEKAVVEAIEAEIRRRQATTVYYLPKKGDVLIWHGALIHSGSEPVDPKRQRRSLIAHYSAREARPDMPDQVLYRNKETDSEGYYANLPGARKLPEEERV